MSDNDPVTWGELTEHCKDRREECGRLRTAEGKGVWSEVERKLDALSAEVNTLKNTLGSRHLFVLPRPILYLLLLGFTAAGLAGREAVAQVVKAFGP